MSLVLEFNYTNIFIRSLISQVIHFTEGRMQQLLNKLIFWLISYIIALIPHVCLLSI